MSLSHKYVGLKILVKSKSNSSTEPNYLLQFEMRYPVHGPGENLEFESACAGKKQTDTIMRVSTFVADPKKLLE